LNLVSVFPTTVNKKSHITFIFLYVLFRQIFLQEIIHYIHYEALMVTARKKIILMHSVQLELLSSVLETVSASIIRFRYDEQGSCLLYLYTLVHTKIESTIGTNTR